eukprot:UN13356
MSVVQVAKLICELYGVKHITEKLEFVRDRNFNDRRYFICHQALINLGWKSTVDFKEGLKQTIQWFRDHKDGHWDKKLVSQSLAAHPEFINDERQENKSDDDCKEEIGEYSGKT